MPKVFIKYVLLILLLLAGFTADIQSKRWAEREFNGKPVVTVLKGFLDLSFAQNRGMVFGIMNEKENAVPKMLLAGVRIIIMIGVLGYMVINRKRSFLFLFPFNLIIAGAAGNIFDNVLFGAVIDFIHIHAGTILDWPFLFNLADVYLCVGMAMLILSGINFKKNTNSAQTNEVQH